MISYYRVCSYLCAVIAFRCRQVLFNYNRIDSQSSVQCRAQFRGKWKADTGKCVDASPLVVQQRQGSGGADDRCVYVGSHSGLFLAIELCSGRKVWQTQLPDRIESSACVSLCGSLVCVGEGITCKLIGRKNHVRTYICEQGSNSVAIAIHVVIILFVLCECE